jgi:hypothetical protein
VLLRHPLQFIGFGCFPSAVIYAKVDMTLLRQLARAARVNGRTAFHNPIAKKIVRKLQAWMRRARSLYLLPDKDGAVER